MVPHQSKINPSVDFEVKSKSENVKLQKISASIEWAFFTNLQIICQTEARLKFTP